jgi:hypothetical protein
VLSRHRAMRPMPACVLVIALVGMLSFAPTFAAEPTPSSAPVRQEDVSAAVEKLSQDPDLATTRETRTLRWVDDEKKKPKKAGWMKWLGDLFHWIAEISRVFVWLLIALLIGLLALYLMRFAKTFQPKQRTSHSTAPTHVRDLDIRPESLPDDIGAAAWLLWEKGEHRPALSLLYRGLLSRLAHAHQVPIRHSSTEGDCLVLAQRHLPSDQRSYVAELIRTWQRAVYGGEDPQAPEMRILCDRFDAALQASTAEGMSS